MKPLDHPCEQRPLRHGESITWGAWPVAGLYVALLQLVGPRGPWDYVIATYYEDGTRVPGGAYQTPSRESAEEAVEQFIRTWRAGEKTPTAAEMLARYEQKRRAS